MPEREVERWRGGWDVPEVLAASRRGMLSPLFSPLRPLMRFGVVCAVCTPLKRP